MTLAGPEHATADLVPPDPVEGVSPPPAAELPTSELAGAVPLPPAPGTRRARRAARQGSHRVRAALMVAVVLVVGGVVTAAALTASRSDPPAASTPGASDPAEPVNRHATLFALAGEDGRASTMAVLVPNAARKGGTVLLVPTGTMTEMTGLGPQPIGRSLVGGDADVLRSTTENLLGAAIESVAVVDLPTLTAALDPAAPLPVVVPERVERVLEGGRVQILFREGPQRLDADEAARYLEARGEGTDLARLARHQVLWEAWIDAIRSEPEVGRFEPAALAAGLRDLASGPVTVRLLPVQAFGTTATDGELYVASETEIRKTVDDVFETTSTARARVRILNGTRQLELARSVERRLAPARVVVTLTGNAERSDYDTTEIIYHDPADRPAAQRVRDALGVGTLIHNRNQTDVVDVTIIVGRDYEA